MEGRNRSGNHSGGVVKNRSSSGCLIIKNKHHGVSGAGSSKGPKLHESKKEKKRPRMSAGDSESSGEEFIEYNRGGRGGTGVSRVSGGSFAYERNDFDEAFGRTELRREVGSNRSQLDVYDFDEYDDLSDVEMMRMSHFYDRGMGSGGERRFLSPMPGMDNGSVVDYEGGSSKGDIIYKRRNSFHGGSSSGKFKGGSVYSSKRMFEMRNELPVSIGKEKPGGSDEAIRLQGKNGVLKVRVKHKEEVSDHLSQNYRQFRNESTVKNNITRPLPYSEKKLPKKPNDRVVKDHQRKRKSVAAKTSEESDEEGEDSDLPPKLQTGNVQVQRSVKRGRTGGSMQSPQTAQPVKAKEGKVKRGSGTEKQLLREKIRSMLVSAGWTIDYRPRRGRDYSDAVYVNPTGTAYWSIIKAYDALQKQLEEEGNIIKANDDDSSFAPISEDVLSKLTRQTRKKIEKELKRKKREEAGGKRMKEFTSGSFEEDESDTDSGCSGKNDDKLSSFMRRSGKSLKGASKESYREGSYSNSKFKERNEKNSSTSNSRFTHARKSKKIGRCTLLVRNSKKGLDSQSDGFIPYTGKRNLLSWLIDSGTVKLSEKVHYMNRRCTRVMLEGWITREGIHCGCCSKILTVSKFEIHAASKLRQPYQNIYLSSGASLMQCQVDAWNKQEDSLRNGYNNINVNGDDPNDDTCAICGDGGNLICCDSCPSTFHQNCLGIKMLPAGDWHCPHCSCKFCGLADMSVTKGNDRRLDSVVSCSFCEGKFHCSCVEELDDALVNSSCPLFCGKTCQELYECLQKLLGVKFELEAGLCWSLIHRSDLESDTSARAYPQKVEWNSKLAVALNVMDECFLPIIDRRSGINMIHSVLYNSGSNITRLDYSGFYTAILEKGDELVAAASIRIRSTEFAEMPFIGTRNIYRRQGMCRRLFSAIESALRSLKIEKLIIPAISELMDTWTTVFGFSSLQESDKQDIKIRNMLVFPGTDMLLKKLFDQDSAERRGLAGAIAFQNDHTASFKPELGKRSDIQSSPGLCDDDSEPEKNEMKDKTVALFDSQDIVCNDETFLHNPSVELCEVKPTLPAENKDMSDKSVTDSGSQVILHSDENAVKTDSGSQVNVRSDENAVHSAAVVYGEEVRSSLPTASAHDSSYNKPSLPTAFASISDEVQPSNANEGDQETTSSELLLDTKFNESSGLLKHNISADASASNCDTENTLGSKSSLQTAFASISDEVQPSNANEGGRETSSSKLLLDTKFNESSCPIKHNIFADASASNCDTENNLDNKPSLQTAFASISDKVQPSNANEGDRETTISELLLDTKFSESAGSVKHDAFADASASNCDTENTFDKKPSLQTAFGSISDEVQPSNVNEGDRETTSSELLLDTKFNESSGPVKHNNSADAIAGNYDTEDALDETSAKHYVGVSADAELTQETNVDVAESVSFLVDDSAATASENGLLNGFAKNGDETQGDGMSFSNNGSSAYENDHSSLKASHPEVVEDDANVALDVCSGSQSLHVCDNDDQHAVHEPKLHVSITTDDDGKDHSSFEASHADVEIPKPPAEASICHSPKVVIDNADKVKAETNVYSGLQTIHFPDNKDPNTSHEPNKHVWRSEMECSENTEAIEVLPGKDHSFAEASHADVEVEKPQHENIICQSPDVELDNSDLNNSNKPSIHVWTSEVEGSDDIETLRGNDQFFADASHVDVEMEKPPADNNVCQSPEVELNNSDIVQAETNVCSASQSLHFLENTDLGAAHEPKIQVSRKDVGCPRIAETNEALTVDDRASEATGNVSDNTVAVEKPLPNVNGGKAEQPSSEDETAHVLPGSNISCEVSVDTIDSNAQSIDDPPSNSNDGGFGVMGLLCVSELHDQGTK